MPTFGAKLEEVVVHGAPDAAERAEKLLFEMADLRFKAGLPAMVLAAAAGLGAWEYHNGSSQQSARAVPSRRRQLCMWQSSWGTELNPGWDPTRREARRSPSED